MSNGLNNHVNYVVMQGEHFDIVYRLVSINVLPLIVAIQVTARLGSARPAAGRFRSL